MFYYPDNFTQVHALSAGFFTGFGVGFLNGNAMHVDQFFLAMLQSGVCVAIFFLSIAVIGGDLEWFTSHFGIVCSISMISGTLVGTVLGCQRRIVKSDLLSVILPALLVSVAVMSLESQLEQLKVVLQSSDDITCLLPSETDALALCVSISTSVFFGVRSSKNQFVFFGVVAGLCVLLEQVWCNQFFSTECSAFQALVLIAVKTALFLGLLLFSACQIILRHPIAWRSESCNA